MKNCSVIGGYYVNNANDKENLLDVLINIKSSRGEVVNYSFLKSLPVERLRAMIDNIDYDFNCVVYETDLNGNTSVSTAKMSSNNDTIWLAGKTIQIVKIEYFKRNTKARILEGNSLLAKEERITKLIMQKEGREV